MALGSLDLESTLMMRKQMIELRWILGTLSADLPFILLQFQANVQGSLNDLDSDVANATQNLSARGLEGDAAREILRNCFIAECK